MSDAVFLRRRRRRSLARVGSLYGKFIAAESPIYLSDSLEPSLGKVIIGQ